VEALSLLFATGAVGSGGLGELRVVYRLLEPACARPHRAACLPTARPQVMRSDGRLLGSGHRGRHFSGGVSEARPETVTTYMAVTGT
jgi:hypothetical protein